ncbi:metallophosphoesterase [Pseudomonas atacamensis]|nr:MULTISPECIES: metallophosphoesterase [Pseudomonas]MDH1259180.1 metallophosphoesterase [Pseudomonas atacamensis]
MPLPAPIRIAIATDLHYTADSAGKISTQVCVHGTKIDPMSRLIDDFQKTNPLLQPLAEILICPGDITTRACIKSFEHGWNDLKNLKSVLQAKHLIAATGNHEVSSRTSEEHETPGNAELAIQPIEHLISTQDYPAEFSNPEKKWVYWGRGYEVLDGDDWVVVTINTCHYHNSLLPNEYERGRIGNSALAELKTELKILSKKYAYKVIVLHHPPLNHEDLDVSLGKIEMYNGNLLLQTIAETDEDWLVIHGHKHLFRLTRSGGEDFSPIVLGAASFGALLQGDLANKTKNQFYIVQLSMVSEGGKNRLRGTVESIYWEGSTWNICSHVAHGLPHGCGFDQSSSVKTASLAQIIKQTLQDSESPVLTWPELREKISELNYLMPKDIQSLQRRLEEIGVYRTPDQGTWFPDELWVNK